MKKTIKSLAALFLVFMLSFGIFMSVDVNATDYFTVKIQMTGMRGANSNSTEVIAQGVVPYTTGMTAFDAIKAIAIQTGDPLTTDTDGTRTYYNQGLLRWYTTNWGGDYISAVKVSGHSNSNKYFSDNGDSSNHTISGNRGVYFKQSNIAAIETEFNYDENATWSNTVNKANYVSEKDYNNFSGWMLLINGDTNNNGLGTTLVYNQDNDNTVILDFSMMMGLDLGQGSYMQDAISGEWSYVPGWN